MFLWLLGDWVIVTVFVVYKLRIDVNCAGKNFWKNGMFAASVSM